MNPFSSEETQPVMTEKAPGKSLLTIALFWLLLIKSVAAQLPSDTMKSGTFNAALLERLIREGVDSVRKAKGIEPLGNDSSLYLAAADQAAYLQYQRTISHLQPVQNKSTVQKRVEHYGGKGFLCGENIAASWVEQLITEKGGKPYRNYTYKQVADDFVRLWVNSSGHHTNLINPLYGYTGVAVTLHPKTKRVVAVQVFGHSKS